MTDSAGQWSLTLIVFIGIIWAVSSCSPDNASSKKPLVVFTEKDFSFSKKEEKYKDLIIKGVNRVHAEYPGCSEITPTSAAISSKGTKANPVFFVACGSSKPFNVWFSKSDIEQGKPLVAKNISDDEAMNTCRNAVLASVPHPSTVDMGRLRTLSHSPNGISTVVWDFEAKNSFGLELQYRIQCLVNEKGLVEEPRISEVSS